MHEHVAVRVFLNTLAEQYVRVDTLRALGIFTFDLHVLQRTTGCTERIDLSEQSMQEAWEGGADIIAPFQRVVAVLAACRSIDPVMLCLMQGHLNYAEEAYQAMMQTAWRHVPPNTRDELKERLSQKAYAGARRRLLNDEFGPMQEVVEKKFQVAWKELTALTDWLVSLADTPVRNSSEYAQKATAVCVFRLLAEKRIILHHLQGLNLCPAGIAQAARSAGIMVLGNRFASIRLTEDVVRQMIYDGQRLYRAALSIVEMLIPLLDSNQRRISNLRMLAGALGHSENNLRSLPEERVATVMDFVEYCGAIYHEERVAGRVR